MSARSAFARAPTRARGARRVQLRASVQHAHRAAPSLPGARRPADPARGARHLRGTQLAYVGDGNNVARSLALLGTLAGVEVAWPRRPATPGAGSGAARGAHRLADAAHDPLEAVAGAQALYTDVWVSMGDEATAERAPLRRSRATASMTRCSTPPLPAPSRCTTCPRIPARRSPRRSSTAPRQRIWDQAENRRHAQKALLELLVASAEPSPRHDPPRTLAMRRDRTDAPAPGADAHRALARPQRGDELELRSTRSPSAARASRGWATAATSCSSPARYPATACARS